MRLFDNAFSPFARKVRLVLDHKGLAHEAIDGLEGEGREELAALNPRIEVPVLDDDGVVVANSSDVVAYLDHKYPKRPALPVDPAVRVRARAIERLADTLVDAILHDVSLWIWPTLDRKDEPPQGLKEAARADLDAVYAELEAELEGKEFFCGDVSIADFALFPHLSGVRFLDLSFSREHHPNLLAWYQRVRTLPPFRKDLERARKWLETHASSKPASPPPIVWRGDRLEWMLAHGFHDWLVEEIRAGRAAWPRR